MYPRIFLSLFQDRPGSQTRCLVFDTRDHTPKASRLLDSSVSITFCCIYITTPLTSHLSSFQHKERSHNLLVHRGSSDQDDPNSNLERFPTLPARSYSTQRLHSSKRQRGGTSTYGILQSSRCRHRPITITNTTSRSRNIHALLWQEWSYNLSPRSSPDCACQDFPPSTLARVLPLLHARQPSQANARRNTPLLASRQAI